MNAPIAPHLLDLLAACTPPDDRQRPVLRERVYEEEDIVDDVETKAEGRRRPDVARPSVRAPRERSKLCDVVLDIVTRDPGLTTRDVAARLSVRTGRPVGAVRAAHLLRALERERRLRATVLRSTRDMERAGGRWLWSAV